MSNDGQISLRLSSERLDKLRVEAADKGLRLSEHMRQILNAQPAMTWTVTHTGFRRFRRVD